MSSLLERSRRGESLADLDIVDLHGHLGRPRFGAADLSPQSLVAAMDRIGVRTILCSHMHCLCAGASVANEEVLAAARRHPGRILGYVRLWPTGPDQVRAETEKYLGQGFVGVKLHNVNGFPYTDPAYVPALEMANQRRMPVLLHTWGQETEFEQVRLLAEQYPDVSLVLAHSGASGKAAEYCRLARDHENVYLDLCMSLAPRGLVERFVKEAGIERVVWGSDALFISMTHQIGKVLGAHLSDEQKRAILSTNARRILGRVQQ